MKRCRPWWLGIAALVTCSVVPTRSVVGGAPVWSEATALDGDTVQGPFHYADGIPAGNGDESYNAVIEIPSGTTAKFEVDEADGQLRWVRWRETQQRRSVDYLAYPANYGMIPRTIGEDGDPLDILVLGAALERGEVARIRLIAVMRMTQDGVRDDKLIGVPLDDERRNGFSELRDLPELDERYPGVRQILALWFSYYWRGQPSRIDGWGDAEEARRIVAASQRVTGRAASEDHWGIR